MKFSEVVVQTIAWLQREGRVSYRALKREFDLDDDYLEDLKEEIIKAKRLAIDEGGSVLVWTGGTAKEETENRGIGETEKGSLKSGVRSLESRPVSAERRQITVMFCDLVGSTYILIAKASYQIVSQLHHLVFALRPFDSAQDRLR